MLREKGRFCLTFVEHYWIRSYRKKYQFRHISLIRGSYIELLTLIYKRYSYEFVDALLMPRINSFNLYEFYDIKNRSLSHKVMCWPQYLCLPMMPTTKNIFGVFDWSVRFWFWSHSILTSGCQWFYYKIVPEILYRHWSLPN